MDSLDLRPGGCVAADFQLATDSRGPLPHACQSPVSVAPGGEHLSIDSAPVVADPHAQISGVFKFELDALGNANDKTRLPEPPGQFGKSHGRSA